MVQFEKISSDEAMKLLDYAVRGAKKFGKPLAAAVCGPEGELIGFIRMDGTPPSSARNAQNKAYTAAINVIETFKLGERMRTKDNPAFWGDSKMTGFGGGVPILHNGKPVGGFGVSGLPEADDIVIATGAVKEVFGE